MAATGQLRSGRYIDVFSLELLPSIGKSGGRLVQILLLHTLTVNNHRNVAVGRGSDGVGLSASARRTGNKASPARKARSNTEQMDSRQRLCKWVNFVWSLF